MPKLISQHHHTPSVRAGMDIVVLVKIRDIRKLSTQAMLSILANCRDRSLYWSEKAAESHLLIVIQRLFSKDKHRVLVEHGRAAVITAALLLPAKPPILH